MLSKQIKMLRWCHPEQSEGSRKRLILSFCAGFFTFVQDDKIPWVNFYIIALLNLSRATRKK